MGLTKTMAPIPWCRDGEAEECVPPRCLNGGYGVTGAPVVAAVLINEGKARGLECCCFLLHGRHNLTPGTDV